MDKVKMGILFMQSKGNSHLENDLDVLMKNLYIRKMHESTTPHKRNMPDYGYLKTHAL